MSLQTRFDQLEEDISTQREKNANWILKPENEWPHKDDYLYDTVPITFDSFQEGAAWSRCRNPANIPSDVYYAIGLGEEAGECLSIVKKTHRDKDGVLTEKNKEKMLGELGDCLFYLSNLARICGIKMSDVAIANQKKMLIRLKEWNQKNAQSV